jgi:glyoxylase-like metal-dependent hydrolase (beta-lactamase superfamily II)
MTEKMTEPIKITPHFYQLGTPSFPAYLSLGEQGMIIEGGTGPTTDFVVKQIETLGIDPQRITSVALTHTHADHIGFVAYLRPVWNHLKVLASPAAAKALSREEMAKEFQFIDRGIAEIMKAKGLIPELPPVLDSYSFEVDTILREGDKIDLGQGIVWTVYDAPGHSPCHLAFREEKEETFVIGDSTGFYAPEKDAFWPNYFQSLEIYCDTMRKLAAIPAKRAALSHNGVIEGDVSKHFDKALKATEAYHKELLKRLAEGEDPKQIALEKAQWVNTITDIQPFNIMNNLTKLLIKISRTEDGKPSFV